MVGVQIEAMIYDMCCKQSACISQGPVSAPAQAVKGSVIHSLILHLGHNPPARNGENRPYVQKALKSRKQEECDSLRSFKIELLSALVFNIFPVSWLLLHPEYFKHEDE